ncbi:ABC transporter permease [Mycobacterium sp. 21AC1]|uniref:ABC transporter permease n=1 Tax=[Mycobacterium] appelbergii TaxID=2939269 RepID=UPI0029393BFD|nr:ABC transporter permease [Mycobacterium sp. 21AC1]MDV3128447.1 ABC transporter permease [Mycobacterium sp. 21AC1]
MAGTQVSTEPGPAVEQGRRRPRRKAELLSERQRNHTIMWVLIAAFLLVWQLVGQASVAYQLTIGTPTDVFAWIVDWATGEYSFGWSDLWITLQEAAFGYLFGTVIGVALAVLFSTADPLRQLLMPFVAAANAVPKIAMAPLFVLAFGTTVSGRAYFVSSLVLFISFFAVFNGLKSIDRKYLDHVAVLGAGWRWTIREVYIPAIIGWLVTSLRLSWTWAISAAVFIEYLSSNEGMGAIVAAGQESLAVSTVIGALAVIAIIAKAVDSALVQIESRMKAWRPA